MAVKIRLQRRGKKGQAFYHIVIADGRAPRDGKFIENIGTYNPLVKPADIKLDFDKALDWLQKGAQPTDTVRSILSYKGILYKSHLLKGVKKGALTEEQANAKFDAWLQEKQDKIDNAVQTTDLEKKENKKKLLEAETKVKDARSNEIAKKRLAEIEAKEEGDKEEVAEGEVKEEAVEGEAKEEVKTEAPKEVTEEKVETKAKEEKPAEVKAEVTPEIKAEEPKKETTEKEVVVEEKKEAKVEKKAEVKEEAPKEENETKAEVKKEEPKKETVETKEEAPKVEAKKEAPKKEEKSPE